VQGREEDAVKEFQKALALDPLAVPIYWDLLTTSPTCNVTPKPTR
jgi:hypothetical protein